MVTLYRFSLPSSYLQALPMLCVGHHSADSGNQAQLRHVAERHSHVPQLRRDRGPPPEALFGEVARDYAKAPPEGAALVQRGGGRLGVPVRRAGQIHHGEDGEGAAPLGRGEAGAGVEVNDAMWKISREPYTLEIV